MTWAIRSCALAAGAAALLSTQAVYAAPATQRVAAVDPLVSLSVLGTTQSRAAVCSAQTAGVSCAVPASMTLAAAAAAAAQPVDNPPPPKRVNTLLLLLGFLVFVGLIVAITTGGGDASGDLTPVSPA